MAAAEELTRARVLIDKLETANKLLVERLETEKRASALLQELNDTRRSETEALKTALAAKDETIAAKNAVIATEEKLIETLKRKKSSPWKRVLDVLAGIGVGAILR